MIFSYYPGCTLKTKAKELDAYARRSAEALGILLEELPEWQCCGGVYTTAKDEIATKLSSVRALMGAKEEGHELVHFARPVIMSLSRQSMRWIPTTIWRSRCRTI